MKALQATVITAALLAVVSGTGCASSTTVDRERLLGAWFSDGPSFEMVIGADTILFELDMLEHPYRLEGDLLFIEFGDQIWVRRILRITDSELVLRDQRWGTIIVLHRKLAEER